MPMLFLYAQLPPRFFSLIYVLHGSLRDYLFLGIKKRPTSIRPYILSQAQVRVKSFFYLLYQKFLFTKIVYIQNSNKPTSIKLVG